MSLGTESTKFAFKVVLAVLGTALAAWLLWFETGTHLERACRLLDTPYLPLCPQAAPEPLAIRKQGLRERLRDNPGDSRLWITLTHMELDEARQALLRALSILAPSDPNSLRMRTRDALERQQIPLAAELLVKMTEHRIGGSEAPQALAQMLASPGGPALLRPYLVPGSRWLQRVLDSMATLKLPLEPGLELLADAGPKGAATPETIQSFVRSLKAAGKWADAYGLWLAQQRRPVPLVFNGSFKQKFQPDGFDWEVTQVSASRTGVVIARRDMAGHGQVLETQFTGRTIAIPMVRQYLFASPGRYLFKGQYMMSKLRMEHGLAWAVRCTDGDKALAGRSQGLMDSGGAWRGFEFEFAVPLGCGDVASLQLETLASFEAVAGLRGRAFFDSFEVRRAGP